MDLIHDLGAVLDVVLTLLSILIAFYTIFHGTAVKALWDRKTKKNRRGSVSGDLADRDD